ncbi:peptidase [Bifidobacterium apri]|uniref:Peptidase n=2 Tax=Bifidobacterium apri TaxID=1769423 RepID=A0A6A2VWP0_9BIFI|nr:peptidase [Bifidobacterium apri]
MKLYYQAHLLNGAPFNTAIGNAYDVTYQYSPYTAQGGEKTPTEHPYVYTYNLKLRKIDGADADKYLAGAQFQMYTDQACTHNVKFTQVDGTYEHDPNGTVTALTTDSDGKINIAGIAGSADGTHYYLKEIKAPAGYRLNSVVIDVAVKVPDFKDQAENARTDGAVQNLTYNVYAQGGYSSVDGSLLVIKNFRGYLPSTGARGIVLTSIAGLLLIGVGMLMMRRKQ